MYHTPVLLQQAVDGLRIRPGGVYVDATFGGGGHARAILDRMAEGKLYGFDQDKDASDNVIDDERFVFINQNFRYLKNFLKLYKVSAVDGILADLGVSSHQFDEGNRGFSTRYDGPLDMRMDPRQPVTAATVVNTYEEAQLLQVFREYGELSNARQVMRAVISGRPFETTGQLKDALNGCFPPAQENKFLARVFQAIRIEVNEELAALREFLLQALEMLARGGRLVVISYHSLEDRLVKNFIKAGNFEGNIEKDFYGKPQVPFSPVNRKPLIPDAGEISVNNRARSAKLKIAEKL